MTEGRQEAQHYPGAEYDGSKKPEKAERDPLPGTLLIVRNPGGR